MYIRRSLNCLSESSCMSSSQCIDVDECLDFLCDPNSLCNNLNGSYQCECNDGFTGNGTVCEG